MFVCGRDKIHYFILANFPHKNVSERMSGPIKRKIYFPCTARQYLSRPWFPLSLLYYFLSQFSFPPPLSTPTRRSTYEAKQFYAKEDNVENVKNSKNIKQILLIFFQTHLLNTPYSYVKTEYKMARKFTIFYLCCNSEQFRNITDL